SAAHEGYIEDVIGNTTTKPTIPKIGENDKVELSGELLNELRANVFSGGNDEELIDHIAKALKILELVKIPNVDPHQLRQHVFLISLTRAASKWWKDAMDGTITTWA
ncbi:hypothetical protein Tco_0258665, partial [Tanacetum coccineum]